MSTVIYFAFIGLMLIGNCFGVYKLFADKQSFITQFPKLTENLYFYFKLLPVINIIALIGLLFWQKWAAYLAIVLGVVVIGFDIYLGIKYHLYVAIISTIVLLFLIFKFRHQLK